MSLLNLLESTGILYRPTIGRDSQQGVTQDPFVPISQPIPCSVQSASATVTMLYRQRNSDIVVTVYLATDPQAQVSDKFVVTDRQGNQRVLLVLGEAQQVDRDVVWVMYARQDPPPAKPTAIAFVVTTPAAASPGVSFSFTVQAVDAVGNPVATYSGAVQFFAFTDDLAVLPAPTLITNGSGTFSATLNTEGSQTLFAQDVVNVSLFGDSDAIDVGPDMGSFAGSEFDFAGSQSQFAGAQ